MAGQISIRLDDKTIHNLNRLARRKKMTRADVMRDCIRAGLELMTTKKDSDLVTLLASTRDEILSSIAGLNDAISSAQSAFDVGVKAEGIGGFKDAKITQELDGTRPKIASGDETTTDALSSDQELQLGENTDPEIDQFFELENENEDHLFEELNNEVHVSGQRNTGTRRPEFDSLISNLDLYLNQHGQMVEGRRRTGRTQNSQNEQRSSYRLRRVREANGWTIEQLASRLKMTPDVVQQIEDGRRDIPHSRGIRVEAKLQQWETELESRDD